MFYPLTYLLIYVNIDKANFAERMNYMAKLVSNLSSVKNGVIATAADDRFYVERIADGISIRQEMVYRRDLVSSVYKDPSPIHLEIIKAVGADTKKDELYLDIVAKQFVDDICEANRLIY